ncbi:MAG: regulatory iron-sulfur-containing complex subunit RicT [Patescibacteria group bacterium]|nr:regulatory iron-sulfur-containing complex subunit RicT [Patescibacteria group bacterium]
MQIIKLQFYPWDNQLCEFNSGSYDVKVGDKIIAKSDLGMEIGIVKSVKEADIDIEKLDKMKVISRIASVADLKKANEKERNKKEAKKYCKEKIKENNLQMKVIDAHFAFDRSCIIFVFIAAGRVDFRELVKQLTRHFQKSVRMQQIGIRDEAKIMGDLGVCGKELCCRKIIKNFVNVRSDLVKLQQLENKSSDRLSGICGRLMCCLTYEKEAYQELSRGLPEIGATVKYKNKKVQVVARQILKRTISIKEKDGVITKVEVDKIKK